MVNIEQLDFSVRPEKPNTIEVGQIWLWRGVGKQQILRVDGVSHRIEVTDLLVGNSFHCANLLRYSEATLVSLPRRDFAAGQMWINRTSGQTFSGDMLIRYEGHDRSQAYFHLIKDVAATEETCPGDYLIYNDDGRIFRTTIRRPLAHGMRILHRAADGPYTTVPGDVWCERTHGASPFFIEKIGTTVNAVVNAVCLATGKLRIFGRADGFSPDLYELIRRDSLENLRGSTLQSDMEERKTQENSMSLSTTHKIAKVELKLVDQREINHRVVELAARFGYQAQNNDGSIAKFGKPGKLVGAIDITPEVLRDMFEKAIMGEGSDHMLKVACEYGIVESVLYVEKDAT